MGKRMENKQLKRNKSIPKIKFNKKTVIGIFIFIFLCTTGILGYSISVNGEVKKWDDKIYPGVCVDGVDVGGMTEEEAVDKLNDVFDDAIADKKLTINLNDDVYYLNYKDISLKYDVEEAAEKAMSFGKDNSSFVKYRKIKEDNCDEKNIPIDFSYNDEKVNKFVSDIKDKENNDPIDASVDFDGKNVTIKDGKSGKVIDEDDLISKIKSAISGRIDADDQISISLEEKDPKITKDDLSSINGVLGSFSSPYGTSAPGRCTNIELATKEINGTLLMPGEEFSFNKVVGPRTEERGFKEAGTYVGNKVEPGIGGGVCQVSTTLYRAAMHANIRPTERTNHSLRAGYAKPGLDATVSFGTLDYKFKNPYDFPIYIQGSTKGKIITYNILGNVDVLDGKTYDMDSEVVETIPPDVKITDDPTLDEGKEVVDSAGTPGYKVNSYQITYEDGKEVNREKMYTDTYLSVESEVRRGTKKPDAAQGSSDSSSNTQDSSQNSNSAAATDSNASSALPAPNTAAN